MNGAALRQAIRDSGMTVQGAAQKAGVSVSTLERWIRGDTSPKLHEAIALREGLGLSTQNFLECFF